MGCVALVSLSVPAAKFSFALPAAQSTPSAPSCVKVEAASAAVRSSPQPGAKVILRVKRGSIAKKLGWDNKYYHIEINGREIGQEMTFKDPKTNKDFHIRSNSMDGWIHQNYVREVTESTPPVHVSRDSYVGTWSKWPGKLVLNSDGTGTMQSVIPFLISPHNVEWKEKGDHVVMSHDGGREPVSAKLSADHNSLTIQDGKTTEVLTRR